MAQIDLYGNKVPKRNMSEEEKMALVNALRTEGVTWRSKLPWSSTIQRNNLLKEGPSYYNEPLPDLRTQMANEMLIRDTHPLQMKKWIDVKGLEESALPAGLNEWLKR